MKQSIIPAALLTAAITAETKALQTRKLYAVKKHLEESFLHRLFFGIQQQPIGKIEHQEQTWNEPDAFSSYE